jgi:hypothetical protein
MVRRDEAELVAYLAENPSGARLVLRETPSTAAALAALRRAADAVSRIRHPDEPTDGLPNYCSVSLEDGLPVLSLDVKDRSDYAGQITSAILTTLDAESVDGRIEPLPWPGPPFDYDGRASIFDRGDYLRELDVRNLPPAFPEGFPVPEGWTLVMAAQADADTWQHAGWRRRAEQPPFAEYLERLRSFGVVLERYPDEVDAEENGMYGYTFHHPGGIGAVWLYHEGLERARRRGRGKPRIWYVTVVWKPAGNGDDALPVPVRLEYQRKSPRPAVAEGDRAEPTLGYDDQGLLYEQGVRDLLAPLLEPGPLVSYETSIVLTHAKDALDRFDEELPRKLPGDEWLNPLLPLRRHRAGVPLDELLERLTNVFGAEDPMPFLHEIERSGKVTRAISPASDGVQVVQLTAQGHRAVDAHLRRRAEHQAALIDGIGPEQLGVVRHTCLQLAVRQAERHRDQAGQENGTPDLPRENGLLYNPDWREFIGPLEPRQILCLETLHALGAASYDSLPRRLRLDGKMQTLLWLHQRRDEGLRLTDVVAGLDVEDPAEWLAEGERAGALSRSPDPKGQVVRLTGRGHHGADRYLNALTREMTERFDGIELDHLAAVRDACWRIVLNYHAASNTYPEQAPPAW